MFETWEAKPFKIMNLQENPTPVGCGCLTLFAVAAFFFAFVSKPICNDLLKRASFVTPKQLFQYEFIYPLEAALFAGVLAGFVVFAIIDAITNHK